MHGTIDHDATKWHTSKRRAPRSLFQFLTARGGLRPDPDLRVILDGKFGWMIRRKGMSLDRAREACVEAGYLQDAATYTGNVTESTIQDLLEIIDAESRGFKQYPAHEQRADDMRDDYADYREEGGEAVGATSPGHGTRRPRKESRRATMTDAQYRKAIAKLGISSFGAGRIFGVHGRQAQRWSSGESPVPESVAKLLRLALKGKITVSDLEGA